MVKRFLVSLVSAGVMLASVLGSEPVQAAGTNVPVLVVGGLAEPQIALNALQGSLRNAGLTVFTMALPGLIPGTQDIRTSAPAVAHRAQQVLSQTGASQLDVVSHSEGGLAVRYYIKNLGGASQVRRHVSLGTPQHGTELANLIESIPLVGDVAARTCVACAQMAVGSPFLADLNSPTDVPGAVTYTALGTTHDELVTPAPQASFLHDGGTNASVQQFCPNDGAGHVLLLFDAPTAGLVVSALRAGPLHTTC
jgi:triacylglycerol lipase